MKSIKKNYFYNLIYQIFLLIVPFVVTPYVSRILTPEGIGQYSFSYTMINYFIVFAGKYRDNKTEQSVQFWNTLICKGISSAFSFFVCVGISFFNFFGDYRPFILILSIEIISVFFDIVYLYQANEEFGIIVLRNLIIKTLSIILIFVFVKSIDDLWIYCLINALVVLISDISLWFGLSKFVERINIKQLKPYKQFKGSVQLFIPTMATTIYLLLNRSLIGFLIPGTETIIKDGVEVVSKISDIQNGYYESADKIIKMVVTVITSIGTVMISRNSYEIKHGNLEIVKNNFYKIGKFVWLLGLPMVLGIISVAGNFVPWFFGSEYDEVTGLLIIESFLIIIIGFSNIYAYLYLMPAGFEKKLGINSVIAAIIDLILCFILIPKFYAMGAMIANVVTELYIAIGTIIMSRKVINFLTVLKSSWKYLLAAIIMFAFTLPLGLYLKSSVLNSLLIVGVGLIVYLVSLIILRDKMIKMIFSFFINFLKRKK